MMAVNGLSILIKQHFCTETVSCHVGCSLYIANATWAIVSSIVRRYLELKQSWNAGLHKYCTSSNAKVLNKITKKFLTHDNNIYYQLLSIKT